MGMYTELIFGASLKKNTPENVIQTLKWMSCLTDKEPENLAFKTKSGRNPISNGMCYSFGVLYQEPIFTYDEIRKEWFLSSRTAIKNYKDEVEDFLIWIKPYISCGSGKNDVYAITIDEESEPVIYNLRD